MSISHKIIPQKTGTGRLKACDSCRYRHIRCEFDGPGACICCEAYDLECSFGKRKDEIYNGRRRRKARKRVNTGAVTTTISTAESTQIELDRRADIRLADGHTSPYQQMLEVSSVNTLLLDAFESPHATPSMESMADPSALPAHAHDIASSNGGLAAATNTTTDTEFDQFCKAMVVPFITDPTVFDRPRSTLLDICLQMANPKTSDPIKDNLVEILCVELNSAAIRDETTCLALLLVSMQTRAAPIASLISQLCLTYALSLGPDSSSAESACNKLLAKVIIADSWNALAQNSKPSIPLSLHPPNPFSIKTEEYMHHMYNLSCLLDRIMLFNHTTTNEERFRVEYELWFFPVALSQKYMWLSPAFASVDANTLHVCFWMLILLYYIPHIGRPYMGLDPSMGLLLPLQHFGRNIMVVMFEFRETLWNWQPARAALRLCIENLCDLEIKYESDEVVSVLKEFVKQAKAPSIFPHFSSDKELMLLITKAEQCDRPVVPRKYDKATVVWMFRDLRVMSLSMLLNFNSKASKT
ncbi:hypothetical protein F5884DRAFT_744478 [Xylogone sp. PMI_703]|nr:hypothetical protein F5884DRAFT_744478 [Xylogone sp. PMI_703]